MNGIGKGNFIWQELLMKIAQVWIDNLHQRGVVGIEIHIISPNESFKEVALSRFNLCGSVD